MHRPFALLRRVTLGGLALAGCTPPPPTVDCSACPRPEVAPAPATCPPPVTCPSPTPTPAPTATPAPIAAVPTPVTPTPPAPPPSAAHDATATTEPPSPLEPPDEPEHLAALFQPKLAALEIEPKSYDRKYGRVTLRIESFVVRGRSPVVKTLNDEVRRSERRDEWAEHAKGRDGDIDVACTAGVATAELFSFVCEILDSSLPIEDVEAGTGGVPAYPTVHTYNVAIAGGVHTPIAVGDLLRADADLAALARAVAGDEDHREQLELKPWRDGECTPGASGPWALTSGGITLYGAEAECANPLQLEFDTLAPLLPHGGVVARHLAAVRAAEAAAEREAAAAAAAATPELPAPTPPAP